MTANGNRKDDALVLALAAGGTLKSAATMAGVAERTAHRRIADPAFRARVTEARERMFDQTLGRLAQSATKAAERLEGLLTGMSETVALGAAKAILDHAVNLREKLELVERVEALEQQFSTVREAKHGAA